ncbi:MAG: hypothetical protein E6Q97_14195 [Desulfurellales bacterium]|nr:MAG: hypothetical protein E6Q97_14195 [Desulfurellales bacterium]
MLGLLRHLIAKGLMTDEEARVLLGAAADFAEADEIWAIPPEARDGRFIAELRKLESDGLY